MSLTVKGDKKCGGLSCRHTIPGEKFDIRKSRVVWWLIKQPEIMQKLFDVASSHKLIEYDVATKKWKGVDFIDDDD